MPKSLAEIIDSDSEPEVKKSLNDIVLKKISVNKSKNIWNIVLSSNSKIEDNVKEVIKKNLCLKFKISGQLNLNFEKNKNEIQISSLKDLEDESIYKKIINDIFCSSPMIACILQNSNYKVIENSLIIYVENEFSLVMLKDKKVESYISQYIKDKFSIDIEVKLVEKAVDFDSYNLKKQNEDKNIINSCLTECNDSNKINTYKKTTEAKAENVAENDSPYIYGKKVGNEAVKISSIINEECDNVTICGEVFKVDIRETKNGKFIYKFFITDYTNSIAAKMFLKPEKLENIKAKVKVGAYLKVQGNVQYDKYDRENIIMVNGIKEEIPIKKVDKSEEKRVELHLHTQMSTMDGVSSATSLIKRAKEWGHSAIAITDHGVVQAFPEAMNAAKETGVKVIYGVEAYLVNDGEPLIIRPGKRDLNDEYVVFDIETTGLSSVKNEIIEIGAVKIKNSTIIDRFSKFVKPKNSIPREITQLTSITDEMVKDADSIEIVLDSFMEFVGNAAVVAHNAKFDTGFIRESLRRKGAVFSNCIVDTLSLSRWLIPNLKKYKLNNLTDYFNIKLENHHRAVDDAEATAEIFLRLISLLKEKGVNTLSDANKLYRGNVDIKKAPTYHIILLVKNHEGLINLYKLISISHMDYFHKRPRMPKSLIQQYREGIIVGSACEAGEVYRSIENNADENELKEIIKFYDYLEIQPRGNNMFLINNGTFDNEEELLNINRKIVNLGERYNKPVVATGDVHFLDPKDEYFRRILMAGQGFSDADNQAPLYFKTTDEMLDEFNYLGKDKAYEVVIKNTNAISDMIENILPIPNETFPPKIDGAEDEIKNMAIKRAHDIYGEVLPEIVEKRLTKELNSIINHGYAVLYLIAYKLVAKSNSDGYIVGSRGSVGSSFVATMCKITEVNPLPPHYVCPNCKNSEFILDGSAGCGADLPDKLCPICKTPYKKDGHDIPFEVFLGFEGDKEPDIDLNFSGDYQPIAHKYTEEIFGKGHVFRAGTIGTIAEKTAYGYVKNYLDERHITASSAEIERLVIGCTGIKRTTGQHPGGVMVVPRDNEIYQFTPIQRPADDVNSDIITTHFDYHSISGRLLKLDILGHDDPTVLRMLQDLTGIEPTTIPLSDEKVLKLFTSTESLGVTPEDIGCEVGTLGLPEFGTKFVRQMLVDTQPKTFAELCRISGLSHGTNVWVNNAQDLIKKGYATLDEVISTRDDIMLYLIKKGVIPKHAFTIMERVRKGKGLRDEDIQEMKGNNVPDWYIESCKKIKYMFPKGHAVAYVMMAVRIAYFKVYYPKAYYATYFTVRADDFDADLICKGKNAVRAKIKEIQNMGNNASKKDNDLLTILEIANEMYCRGINVLPVDLYKSDSVKFLIKDEEILPPLNALQGVGDTAAKSIVSARENGEFLSKEDLRERAKISKTVIQVLDNHGCLKGFPETNQLSLF